VEREFPLPEEKHGPQRREDNDRPAEHLEDARVDVEEANAGERRARNVAARRQQEEHGGRTRTAEQDVLVRDLGQPPRGYQRAVVRIRGKLARQPIGLATQLALLLPVRSEAQRLADKHAKGLKKGRAINKGGGKGCQNLSKCVDDKAGAGPGARSFFFFFFFFFFSTRI
jgi:hypothetical protein